MPFDLHSEPRVHSLELVAWTKLYKRSFLREHAIQFEEGMSSFEDSCFHFSGARQGNENITNLSMTHCSIIARIDQVK